nr:PREDICTED: reversion-inducing cysteine-rich protein with Kazal motifs-like [Phalacrocorax carbo]
MDPSVCPTGLGGSGPGFVSSAVVLAIGKFPRLWFEMEKTWCLAPNGSNLTSGLLYELSAQSSRSLCLQTLSVGNSEFLGLLNITVALNKNLYNEKFLGLMAKQNIKNVIEKPVFLFENFSRASVDQTNCPDRPSSGGFCSEVIVKRFKPFKYVFPSPCFSIGLSCCYHAKDNLMCRDVCEQILSSKSDSRLKHLLQRAPEYCPESMGEVWGCINSSLPGVLKKSDGWVGLGCCELAIAVECRQACKQASAKNDVLKVCRKEYENALFSCINRNEMGSVCCSYAGHHTNCREYCQAIFRTDSSPGPSQIKAVENYCASISPQLIHCVNNYTQSYPMRNPTDSLYCCDRAEDYACQTACKRILMSMKTELEIVDGLIEGCKTMPLPQDPLWQCFLESSRSVHPGVTVHPPPSTGLDGAKLHCCSKANSSTCRELCTKLYSTSWGNSQSWQEFDRFCEYNAVEVSMLTCLADVREPCQLGCRNLTYCTNFNNRPTELFRSCNTQSDQGAMNDMKLWEKGSIKMPFINIPVLDIKKCQPEMWKAIACSLQIKPCHSKSRGSIICK